MDDIRLLSSSRRDAKIRENMIASQITRLEFISILAYTDRACVIILRLLAGKQRKDLLDNH